MQRKFVRECTLMEDLVEEYSTKVIKHFTLLSFDGECIVF
ncbi:hypothetical protein B4088_1831 [Bacillus cereus]|uniref:Uncharacterized protein n=1 Tax=Bacillus cereus TaxID=1396 RepID=A0A164PPY1_BACCE|nr:hypothetical protein B4088_1831 [Bacillus cereus]